MKTKILIVFAIVLFSSCSKNNPAPVIPPVVTAPSVTTGNVSVIGSTYAVSGGEVVNDGGSPVTARGIVWSTQENPTTDLTTKVTDISNSTGVFVANIAPLTTTTKYYVRAFASNSIGTVYGNEVAFTTSGKGPCLVASYTIKSMWLQGTYHFTYDGSGKLATITDNSYKYSGDSVYIKDLIGGLHVTVASANGNVQSIKKYFAAGGIYRYTFDYSVAKQITITEDYPNLSINNFQGVYKFDDNGNVQQYDLYKANNDGVFEFQQTWTYTYDQSENPVRGLALPFFDWQTPPPVYYFSANNVLTETTNNVTKNYVYQYAANGLPVSASVAGSGAVMQYSYVNCPF